ncbi:MAG: hypothetical protein HYS18_07920 [Burkholderiales bacterium]|nr:hypothetical protein [Burkholderiales bacterium]
MSKIIIQDLVENATLDRKAMRAITGGARAGGRQTPFSDMTSRDNRVIDYPTTRPMTKSSLFK